MPCYSRFLGILNITKNLPCHNTWKSGNFKLPSVGLESFGSPWTFTWCTALKLTRSMIPDVIWHHRQQGTTGFKLLGFVERFQPDYLAQNVSFQCNKERSRSRPENLRSARCSPPVFSKVLAARKTYWITARARKNKRTARMLASARKDHSILLT